MKKIVCAIIPIYKEELTCDEEKAIVNNLYQLKGIDTYLIGPNTLNCRYYNLKFSGISIIRFEEWYFQSVKTYNKLMLKVNFYRKFCDYKYMLICQPDAWILKGEKTLRQFIGFGYDYIGAPWNPGMKIQLFDKGILRWYSKTYELCVGNGGLSLRNINSTIRILMKYYLLKSIWNKNEDLFFSFIGEKLDRTYRIPNAEIASRFSLEYNSRVMIKKRGIIPFGVHAYDEYYEQLPDEVAVLKKVRKGNKKQ